MFLGVSTLNLDAKGRLAVPAKYRDALAQCCASRVVVTVNPDDKERCLLLYPENEWFEVARELSRRDSMHPMIRAMQRLMVGYASEHELDAQGRILLSAEQREFAGLGKKVALVGQANKIEIWDADVWSGNREQWLTAVAPGSNGLPEELKGFRL
ncbi:MAG: division/cell wall cluster transcriptional repressor MraZ [Chromatiaceae bacterium]|nr:division/cell wall cluster transcriptional repressor MraZ [Gammaproteobacteria bacterium]MCP5313099.1 division/cell wall cluster transcriptional repressor MraZ [Chromatiaceae bacterium]